MSNIKLTWKVLLLLLTVQSFVSNSAKAQDSTRSSWHFLVEPYFMFPNMKGEVGIKILPPAEIDADASQILGNLNFGAMLYFEASSNRWILSSDFLYMDLKQDIETGTLITGGYVQAKQLGWELAGMRHIAPWFDAGFALRMVGLESELNVETLLSGQNASTSKFWVDPVFVFRSQGLIKDKWILQGRADFGGFSIGSDWTWQLQANAGYRFSKLFQATIGYRILSIDYDKGDVSDRFIYDVDTYGAVVRLGFNF